MLGEKMRKHDVNVWMINTGWTGGPFGTGNRIKLSYTRAMITAALNGVLDKVAYKTYGQFKLAIPESVPGVPDEILEPRNTWADAAAYDAMSNDLAGQFLKNFEKYAAKADPRSWPPRRPADPPFCLYNYRFLRSFINLVKGLPGQAAPFVYPPFSVPLRMQILDGKLTSQAIKDQLAEQTTALKALGKKAPHLAAILVGNDGASETYVASKVKSCAEIGYNSTLLRFEDTISEKHLLDHIIMLNENPDIDGILVQLPFPGTSMRNW